MNYSYDRRFASKLKLGPRKPYPEATQFLSKAKPVKRRRGVDMQGALRQAAWFAQQLKKSVFVFQGNSYMHKTFNVSYNSSDYLSPINNTGGAVAEVTPELQVFKYDVIRPKAPDS